MDNKELILSQTKMPVRRIISIAFIIVAGAFSCFILFKYSTTNYEKGYIRTRQHGFILTVKGRRNTIVRDSISWFGIKSYEDSMQYKIPRSKGIIRGEEIEAEMGYRKLIGTITIENGDFNINLFNYNTTSKKVEADAWNGPYKLEWRIE